MGDDNMQEFDDPAQRQAICEKQWKEQHGMKTSSLISLVLQTPWAILPAKLAAIVAVLIRHESGARLTAEEVQLQIGSVRRNDDSVRAGMQGVAILPLYGAIFPRANLMTETSGATSAESFGRMFRQAMADTNVGAVVLDIDSPGGAVSGIDELSFEIARSRGAKPVVAVANHLAASAAYWIATAADEIVVPPSAEVGSIGVFAAHEDVSKALEAEGVKVTLVSAGKYKVEGNPYEPLTEEARSAIEIRVADFYNMFVSRVAKNRGVSAAAVRNGYGEGRVVGAKDARASGMADRIDTLEGTIARVAKQIAKTRSPKADLEFRERRARALTS